MLLRLESLFRGVLLSQDVFGGRVIYLSPRAEPFCVLCPSLQGRFEGSVSRPLGSLPTRTHREITFQNIHLRLDPIADFLLRISRSFPVFGFIVLLRPRYYSFTDGVLRMVAASDRAPVATERLATHRVSIELSLEIVFAPFQGVPSFVRPV